MLALTNRDKLWLNETKNVEYSSLYFRPTFSLRPCVQDATLPQKVYSYFLKNWKNNELDCFFFKFQNYLVLKGALNLQKIQNLTLEVID